MRLLVLGAKGLVGTAIRATAEADARVTEVVALGHADIDVTDREEVFRALHRIRPDACVNTAALMPADPCDETPERAYAVNTLGARWVGRACADVGAVPVYISSDFVFDGLAGLAYRPEDPPRPVQTYGVTKLAGEHETRLAAPRYLITRSGPLFGPPPDDPAARPCAIDRMAARAAAGDELKMVDNVVMSPTYAVDLATTIIDLLHHSAPSGIYHAVNSGSASWYEWCRFALDRLGYGDRVTAVQDQTFTSVARPPHTPLAGALPDYVQRIRRSWQAAVDAYLEGSHER